MFLMTLVGQIFAASGNNGRQKEISKSQGKEAKVALLGVFHFQGSSDMASMHMADPFGKRRQDDIKEVVRQIAVFKPTKILVEYPKSMQIKLQEHYSNYLAGKDTLTANEIDQLGFRLAKQLGHTQVYAIDYQLNLPDHELMDYFQRNNKMAEFELFIKRIQEYVSQENKKLNNMKIASYLARTNVDSVDSKTNQAYIGTTFGDMLSWGDSTNEAGVHFSATWWQRNMVILKNIAETIKGKDERVLVIIGSGHRAVLKNLIKDRNDMEYVEIGEYLR